MAFPLQFLLETVLPQLLMGKDKKKHSKKDKASEDILDAVALSLKKFRKVTKEISRLSTGQKVVGSLVLAAAGLVYLATRETDDAPNEHATPALLNEANAPSHHRKASRHHQHFSEE
ncbi:hypothetical protein [Hymenobacter segetis]|uniref:YtxH domain-containing protein n=1 Tax=Hymenobacter segetis TaxID=2025509 RepID=A0ABU9LWJ3_9BACT